jgi:hypothetical protein
VQQFQTQKMHLFIYGWSFVCNIFLTGFSGREFSLVRVNWSWSDFSHPLLLTVMQWLKFMEEHLEFGHYWLALFAFFVHSILTTSHFIWPPFYRLSMPSGISWLNTSYIRRWPLQTWLPWASLQVCLFLSRPEMFDFSVLVSLIYQYFSCPTRGGTRKF